ncbi:MAG: type II toxin-antitoxin system VapC family toxin [Pirellulales bacterium]|nr:type II toxin-antitoxin system VapC family toxin [Pirellulales bacterium]
MKRSILDTDIFSEVIKGRNAAVAATAKNYRAAFTQFTISAITVMEIVQGLHKKGPASSIQQFLELADASEILDFDRPAAELAGRIFADLERTGQPIGRADPMIAGIALHHGLVLVTANTNHFQRISELRYPLQLENWREAPAIS